MGPRAGWGCRSARPRPSTSPGASTRPQRGRSWPRAGAAARRPVTLGALLGRPASTVGKVLRRRGQSRRPRLPRPPVVRYERASPGELLHLDTKKLGRFWHVGKRITRDGVTRSPGAGWPHVHVAVDDHSRLAYAEVRPSDRQADALAFLDRALAWFRAQGIVVRAVMTDNGVYQTWPIIGLPDKGPKNVRDHCARQPRRSPTGRTRDRAGRARTGRAHHRHGGRGRHAGRRRRRRRCGCIRQRIAVPVPERRGHVHRKRQHTALVGQPATGRTRGARTGCLHHGLLGGRRIHLLVLGGCGAAAIAVWYRRVHAMADADHRLTLFGIVSTWAHGAPHAPTDAVPVERDA